MIDDIDHGGAEALQMVAARAATASTAVVVTSVLPPGVGTQLRLTGLSEDELAEMLPDLAPQARHECGWPRAACRASPGRWPRT